MISMRRTTKSPREQALRGRGTRRYQLPMHDELSNVEPSPFAMQLRLDTIRNDGVGWLATFYGKPDMHGNQLSVPVSEEVAKRLEPGKQYVFVEVLGEH